MIGCVNDEPFAMQYLYSYVQHFLCRLICIGPIFDHDLAFVIQPIRCSLHTKQKSLTEHTTIGTKVIPKHSYLVQVSKLDKMPNNK